MTIALLLVDLQNDFLHPNGAYARGGATSPALAALPARVAPVVAAARAAAVPVVATLFTLVPGIDPAGEPLVADHLRRLRPFLGRGDFAPGSWGHQVLDEVGPPNATVEKVVYDAFLHTRLEWLLGRLGVDHVVMAGIVTNGGVASTARAAHARDLRVTVLGDGCAAFDPDVHDATLRSLAAGVATIARCADAIDLLA